MKKDIINLWQKHFPSLANTNDENLLRLMSSANVVELPGNKRVFQPGVSCQNYLLVVHGTVRVQILAESGREVVLYRVHSGESCILTTSCLLGEMHYPAEGITESDVTAFAIPAADFNMALMHSGEFRRFVFDTLGKRLTDVLVLMEQVTFGAIDSRLANILFKKAKSDRIVKATHHQLATELGTAREVVSRHLKRFEGNGWVELGRGTIVINSPEKLKMVISEEVV